MKNASDNTVSRCGQSLWLVLIASVILAAPLLWSGFPASTLDGPIHMRWAHHASVQFWDGVLYPRWFPELNGGFGSPSFFYYPPLSTVAAAVFWPFAPEIDRVGFSAGWAAALGLILSGISMWLFLRRTVEKQWVAAVCAILYVAAPFHLGIGLLTRGANAEFWAYVFMPLVLLAFHNLGNRAKDKTDFAVGRLPGVVFAAFCLAGLFCTHLLTAMTFAPIAISYALSRGRTAFADAVFAGGLSLCLCAAYLFPMTLYPSYTVGGQDMFFMGEFFNTTFFLAKWPLLEQSISENIAFQFDAFVVFAGFFVILVTGFALFMVGGGQQPRRRDLILWLILLQICLFMMLPFSEPLYYWIPGLKRVQFVSRFLCPATVSACVIISIFLDHWSGRIPWQRVLSSAALAGFLVPLVFVNAKAYAELLSKHNRALNLRATDAMGEYVPRDANIDAALQIFGEAESGSPTACKLISGEGKLTIKQCYARTLELQVEAESPLLVILHQFWFPNWVVTGAESTGISAKAQQGSGLIELEIPPGTHSFALELEPLWPESVGAWVSGLTLSAMLLAGAGGQFRRVWRKEKPHESSSAQNAEECI